MLLFIVLLFPNLISCGRATPLLWCSIPNFDNKASIREDEIKHADTDCSFTAHARTESRFSAGVTDREFRVRSPPRIFINVDGLRYHTQVEAEELPSRTSPAPQRGLTVWTNQYSELLRRLH